MRKNRVSPLLERPWLGTNYSRDGGSSCDRAYEVTVHVEVARLAIDLQRCANRAVLRHWAWEFSSEKSRNRLAMGNSDEIDLRLELRDLY